MSSGNPFTSLLFAEGVEGAREYEGDTPGSISFASTRAELTHLHFVKSCYTSSVAIPCGEGVGPWNVMETKFT